MACEAGHRYTSVEIPETLFKKLRLATPTFQKVKERKAEIRRELLSGAKLRDVERKLHTSSQLVLEVVQELEIQGIILKRSTKYAAKRKEAKGLLEKGGMSHSKIAKVIGTTKGFVTQCNKELQSTKRLDIQAHNVFMNVEV